MGVGPLSDLIIVSIGPQIKELGLNALISFISNFPYKGDYFLGILATA